MLGFPNISEFNCIVFYRMNVLWKISQPAVFVVIVWTTVIIETLVNADVYVVSIAEYPNARILTLTPFFYFNNFLI